MFKAADKTSLPLSHPETAVHVDTVHVAIGGLLQTLHLKASMLNELGIRRYKGCRPPDHKTSRQHLHIGCLEQSIADSHSIVGRKQFCLMDPFLEMSSHEHKPTWTA